MTTTARILSTQHDLHTISEPCIPKMLHPPGADKRPGSRLDRHKQAEELCVHACSIRSHASSRRDGAQKSTSSASLYAEKSWKDSASRHRSDRTQATERLAPDFKTIADFRRDNGEAIRAVCREFVVLCRRLRLFSDGIVAIDGSKFKAVNNRDKNFIDRKLQARMKQLEESIDRYLVELDRADRQAASVLPTRVTHLKDKLAKVREQMKVLDTVGQQLEASEDRQVSLTDPDARSMATSGRGTGIVG
jgi:hypothetical protein